MNHGSKQIFLLTNIPAPYRIPVWNRLFQIAGGKVKLFFLARSESRRKWALPVERMTFHWKILCGEGDPDRFSNQVYAAAAILFFLVRERPRAVVCGGYNSVAAWVSFCWCKLFRSRFVLWLEGTERDCRKPDRIRRAFKKWMVSRADGIAASGKATVAYVVGLGAARTRIFHAPFGGDVEDLERQAGAIDPAAEKQKLGFPPRLILYSGRLAREKGVFVLLEAFRRVAGELGDAGLLVVGHGPEGEAMRRMARELGLERIFFAGAQPYERMPYFYALADLLVLPTFSDPWGYVVNEAFACGVPAIVSRAAGACDDLLHDGETGYVVEPGDPVEIAERILLLLRDETLRRRIGANCRAYIRRYSAGACAQGLLAAARGSAQ